MLAWPGSHHDESPSARPPLFFRLFPFRLFTVRLFTVRLFTDRLFTHRLFTHRLSTYRPPFPLSTPRILKSARAARRAGLGESFNAYSNARCILSV